MKKHTKYIQCLWVIGLATCMITLWEACNKLTDLTRLPQDQLTNETYWNSWEDIKTADNQFYPYFRKQLSFWQADMYFEDGNSDNIADVTNDFNDNSRATGVLTINSFNGEWNTWYSRIRDVNIVLSESKKHDLLTTKEGKQYFGEAKFFRAYFYYQLVRDYGGVPWIGKPLNTDSKELQAPRTPRGEIVDSILADLDYAITNLPPRSSTGNNRLNKETTLLFKSRVALYEGTWETYHKGDPFEAKSPDPDKFLKIAAQSAMALMDMGITLAPTYLAIYSQLDLSGFSQVFLARKYSVANSVGNDLKTWANTELGYFGNGAGLTRNLIRSYLMKDGKPIAVSSDYKGDKTLKDVVADRDPRLHAILRVPGDTLGINHGSIYIFEKAPLTGSGITVNPTGYQLKKGLVYGQVLQGNQPDNVIPIFHYSEALLNYAEAKATLGNLTQEDLDISVNKLRDRVGMPHIVLGNITTDPNWKFPELSPVLNEIRRERRVELSCEAFRFDDLMRWNAGGKLLTGFKAIGAYFEANLYPDIQPGKDIFLTDDGYISPFANKFPNGYTFDPAKDYLLPIPPTQILLNPNLTQNPGWK